VSATLPKAVTAVGVFDAFDYLTWRHSRLRTDAIELQLIRHGPHLHQELKLLC
jgi:hypothetical protein